MISGQVKITILVDNRAGDGLIAEHGLSLWIEADGMRILFDTGQGNALEANARTLGLDLCEADILVLSHGHYDHTGGVPQVLKAAQRVCVYGHSGIMQRRYSIRGEVVRAIQMPEDAMGAIRALPAERLHWVTRPMSLSEGVRVTGQIPRETDFEDPGGPFYCDQEGKCPDPIEDDMALWVRTNDGLIVCVGCAHAGVVNTARAIQAASGEQKVRAIIGGFHLLNASRDRLEETVAALRRFDPEIIVPCHCTGQGAADVLRTAFGERVSAGAAGVSHQF